MPTITSLVARVIPIPLENRQGKSSHSTLHVASKGVAVGYTCLFAYGPLKTGNRDLFFDDDFSCKLEAAGAGLNGANCAFPFTHKVTWQDFGAEDCFTARFVELTPPTRIVQQ